MKGIFMHYPFYIGYRITASMTLLIKKHWSRYKLFQSQDLCSNKAMCLEGDKECAINDNHCPKIKWMN